MILNFDVKNLLNGFFYGLYARVAKLQHFAGICKYYVVVLFVKKRLFVMGLVLPELMLAHQGAFQQQFYGIVKRGAAYTVVFVFHFNVEAFYIKMFLAIINFLEYGVTLRCFSVAVVFQKFGENVFYYFLVFFAGHYVKVKL